METYTPCSTKRNPSDLFSTSLYLCPIRAPIISSQHATMKGNEEGREICGGYSFQPSRSRGPLDRPVGGKFFLTLLFHVLGTLDLALQLSVIASRSFENTTVYAVCLSRHDPACLLAASRSGWVADRGAREFVTMDGSAFLFTPGWRSRIRRGWGLWKQAGRTGSARQVDMFVTRRLYIW